MEIPPRTRWQPYRVFLETKHSSQRTRCPPHHGAHQLVLGHSPGSPQPAPVARAAPPPRRNSTFRRPLVGPSLLLGLLRPRQSKVRTGGRIRNPHKHHDMPRIQVRSRGLQLKSCFLPRKIGQTGLLPLAVWESAIRQLEPNNVALDVLHEFLETNPKASR